MAECARPLKTIIGRMTDLRRASPHWKASTPLCPTPWTDCPKFPDRPRSLISFSEMSHADQDTVFRQSDAVAASVMSHEEHLPLSSFHCHPYYVPQFTNGARCSQINIAEHSLARTRYTALSSPKTSQQPQTHPGYVQFVISQASLRRASFLAVPDRHVARIWPREGLRNPGASFLQRASSLKGPPL